MLKNLEHYVQVLKIEKNHSSNTVNSYLSDIKSFEKFLKKRKITFKKFKKEVPPRFITFIEKHFNIESLHIFYDKDIHFGKKYYIETKPCECYLCKKDINFIKMNGKFLGIYFLPNSCIFSNSLIKSLLKLSDLSEIST